MKIMNKRGDKILSVYWFAVLIIVAGGIFAMVYIYYGAPYDVREIESNVLINKLADCVSYAGRINTNLISEGEFHQKTSEDFLRECNILFSSGEWEDEQYYAEVDFYNLEDLNVPVLNISAGDNKWVSYCELQEEGEKEKLTKCNSKSFYSLDDLDNQYIIKILAVVRKSEKNVKL
jgi:hypothetical protein